MSSSSGTTVNQSNDRSWGPCRSGRAGKGNWTGLNIAVMVASFVVFWPFGLFVLFWILTGRNDRINEIKHEIKMRSERFKEFRNDAQRRADKEEFDRFMSNTPGSVDVG